MTHPIYEVKGTLIKVTIELDMKTNAHHVRLEGVDVPTQVFVKEASPECALREIADMLVSTRRYAFNEPGHG